MTTPSKHVLIVGASAGIGRAIALQVAPLVTKLTLCSRTCPPDLLASVKAINPDVDVVHERLDVSLLHEVREFTTKHATTDFDWIVLTAGVMTGHKETSEGLELGMATAYYGRFMLVHDLLPRLNRPGFRFLTVFHAGQATWAPSLDDLGLKRSFTPLHCANACKLYWYVTSMCYVACGLLLIHAPQAAFLHINPGFVNTTLFDGLPWFLRWPASIMKAMFAMSPEQCATEMVAALTSDEYAVGWELLDEHAKVFPKTKFHSEEFKDAVWKHSVQTIDGILQQ
ncbi:hypothetical protein BBJ28_00008501 [Nothophytophthora sp. Chile5]|nr:hypothetical protein BBJ28_00008501 [Nothophytophthora sp. Chile5]